MQPRREARLAAELADPDAELGERLLRRVVRVLGIAEQVPGEPLDGGGMSLAERRERLPVSVLRACHQNWVAQPLVDERPAGARDTGRLTAWRGGRLQGAD